MKLKRPVLPGVGVRCRLPVILLIFTCNIAISQDIAYNPDRIFKGSHYSLEVKWVSNFATEFERLEGYDHAVHSKPDFGYEVGLKWRFYFNKHWSVETGIEAASRRLLIVDYDIDSEVIKSEISTDPMAQAELAISLNNREPSKYGLGPTFAIPVHLGYHQYLGKSSRHILDYRIGIAVRFHIPMYIYKGDNRVILHESDSSIIDLSLHKITYDWYDNKKVSVDLQPYVGYTFIPKNRHAFSIGLLANLSFEKNYQDTENFQVLPGTSYEEQGVINVKPHYLAVQIAYTFTTKRNTLAVKKKKKKRSTGVY